MPPCGTVSALVKLSVLMVEEEVKYALELYRLVALSAVVEANGKVEATVPVAVM